MTVMSMRQAQEKVGLQVAAMLVLLSPLAYMYIIYPTIVGGHFEPRQRGFFCDDENLRRPYVEKVWVPTWACFVIWIVIGLVTVIPLEIIVTQEANKKGRSLPIKDSQIPLLAVNLYRILGSAAVGNLSCLLATEVSKYTVGRLRPHFLTICDPFDDPFFNVSSCVDQYKYKQFVEVNNTECFLFSNGTYSEKQLRQARLSFMSGHASFSFCNAIFLVIYVKIQLSKFHSNENGSIIMAIKRLRVFIQFGFLILAFWISLTRVSDYFHHPLDVVMGAVTGITGAILGIFFTGVFSEKSEAVIDDKTKSNGKNEKKTKSNGKNEKELLQEYETQKTDVSLI